jgi:hypothetical protein
VPAARSGFCPKARRRIRRFRDGDNIFNGNPLQVVSSIDDFLFSGKEDELFMQGVYSYGTRPE